MNKQDIIEILKRPFGIRCIFYPIGIKHSPKANVPRDLMSAFWEIGHTGLAA